MDITSTPDSSKLNNYFLNISSAMMAGDQKILPATANSDPNRWLILLPIGLQF